MSTAQVAESEPGSWLSGDELLLIAARQILVSIAVQTGEANDKLSLLIAIRLDKSVVAATGLPEL